MASQFTIPVAVVVTVGLSEYDQIIHGNSFSIRPVLGGFIMGAVLFALSDLDTRLGSLFAVLVVINALINHGTSVFKHIGGNAK